MRKTNTKTTATDYAPFDDRTQPTTVVEGYRNTLTRTPRQAPYPLQPCLGERTGPLFATLAPTNDESNLCYTHDPQARALGQMIEIAGRVVDERARPVTGCLIEIWQANAAGKYAHKNDQTDNPLDENFRGSGRALTNDKGEYRFITVKPGAYPTPESGNWWRPPHVHFSLFGENNLQRLVTQMYFEGEPLNRYDRILNCIPDANARAGLTATLTHSVQGDGAMLHYTQDFVLRGQHQTPFEGR